MPARVKHVMREQVEGEEFLVIVFENLTPPSLSFPVDVALDVSKALNAHFARRARFERELESKNDKPKLLTHVGKDDETDGGQGPEVA